MGLRKQVHVMMSRALMERLDAIADAEDFDRSELMRRVLVDFVRSYRASDPRLQPPRRPSPNLGTDSVQDRYKTP